MGCGMVHRCTILRNERNLISLQSALVVRQCDDFNKNVIGSLPPPQPPPNPPENPAGAPPNPKRNGNEFIVTSMHQLVKRYRKLPP